MDGQCGRVSGVPQPASISDKLFTVLIVSPYNDGDHGLLSAAMADCR
jgi:hypothetical protein